MEKLFNGGFSEKQIEQLIRRDRTESVQNCHLFKIVVLRSWSKPSAPSVLAGDERTEVQTTAGNGIALAHYNYT